MLPEDGVSLLGSSYDNTGALGASTWRHVKFIEQPLPSRARLAGQRPDRGNQAQPTAICGD